MRVKLRAEYGFKPTPDQMQAIIEHDPTAKIYTEGHWVGTLHHDGFSVDQLQLARVLADRRLHGCTFRVELGDVEAPLWLSMHDRLVAIEERVRAYTPPELDEAGQGERIRGGEDGGARQWNEKVHVHVPNLGLLLVNEIQVVEDCCSNSLQDELDRGWRILAVCPQPNQRRPDYVLGRTKADG